MSIDPHDLARVASMIAFASRRFVAALGASSQATVQAGGLEGAATAGQLEICICFRDTIPLCFVASLQLHSQCQLQAYLVLQIMRPCAQVRQAQQHSPVRPLVSISNQCLNKVHHSSLHYHREACFSVQSRLKALHPSTLRAPALAPSLPTSNELWMPAKNEADDARPAFHEPLNS